MPRLVLTDPDGGETVLQGGEGVSAMQLIRASGVPGFGECSGSLACATCHVVVDPAWSDRLAPPGEDEEAMLDTAFDLTPTSRLSCQISLISELDGLRVSLPG